MSHASLLVVIILTLIVMIKGQGATFHFGNTQGDYMVLQQQPNRAQVWGFSTSNDIVTITLQYQSNSSIIETVTAETNSTNSIWKGVFSPRTAQNNMEYIVTATSKISSTKISLSHILFGDVFICSGQSNMQFAVDNAFNATQECQAANNYPNIRVYTVAGINSTQPELEVKTVEEPWSISNASSICNANWTYFSAVCWFYGRDLYSYLNYPLGLVDTSYGGTPIRAWMSPEARAVCNESATNCPLADMTEDIEDKPVGDIPDSSLWNAMIYPFTQSTIKGAIWYQGERDSKEPYCATQYHCAMPEMINNWREYWHLRSDTNAVFPFGYVQLSTWNCYSQNETCSSPTQNNTQQCYDVGIVRWGQSANFGFVPNKLMLNTFMAGSIDLGDPSSPWGQEGIHPRYKQEVGKRLSDAAKNIIYGESEIYFQGPVVDKFTLDTNDKIAIITFRNVGEMGMEIKHFEGFEFYSLGKWITMSNTTFTTNGNYDIVIPLKDMDSSVFGNIETVRYEWFHCPCFAELGPFNCPIYDKQFQLPALPFIINVTDT